MTTQYTIKQALSLSTETIQALPLTNLEALVATLAVSTDKKALRKIDMIQGILNGLKKDAPTPEAKAEVVAVENSVKRLTPAQMKAKKAKAEAEKKAQEELLALAVKHGFATLEDAEAQAEEMEHESVEDFLATLEESEADHAETVADLQAQADALKAKAEAEKKAKAKAKAPAPSNKLKDKQEGKASKPDEDAEIKKLKAEIARLKAVEKEAEILKDGIFQAEIEIKGGKVLKKISLPTVADVTKVLIERPYTLQMHVHEGVDSNLTVFNVLFMNSNVLVLLDRSRDIDSVLPIKVTTMTAETITIDNRKCPFRYYITEVGEVEEAEAE